MAEQNNQNQLNIELNEELAEGQYSNLAIIAHSGTEFVIDFLRILPNMPKAKVKSRIVMTPEHAKRLLRALQENVKKYEKAYGVINEPQNQNGGNGGNPFGNLSFTPTAEA